MTEVISNLIQEAKKNRAASSLNAINDEGLLGIWSEISAFIEKQMLARKGVLIPGFATFGFCKLSVPDDKFGLNRPVFHLSEKFLQTLGLEQHKGHISGDIPQVPINYAAIAFETPFARDAAESCAHEVLRALERSVAAGRNVELAFGGVGRLVIRQRRAKFKFYRTFLNSLDTSGSVAASLENRPGTADSVMSERPPSRLGAQTVLLPSKAAFDGGRANMPSIAELEEEQRPKSAADQSVDVETQTASEAGDDAVPEGQRAEGDGTSTIPLAQDSNRSGESEPATDGAAKEETRRPFSRMSTTRKALPMASVAAMSLGPGGSEQTTARVSSSPALATARSGENPDSQRSDENYVRGPPLPPIRPQSARSMSSQTGAHPIDSLPDKLPTERLSPPSRAQSSCSCHEVGGGGGRAGQELCYLCHQRARRNQPVSFEEERRRREEEENRMLDAYHRMKVAEFRLQQEEDRMKRVHEEQKTAAFNLGTAEAVRTKHSSKPSDSFPSYLFQQRPLTPPKVSRQEAYRRELERQVEVKEETRKRLAEDEALLDRMEHEQRAEELAAERERYLRLKLDKMSSYKNGLDTQVEVAKSGVGSPGVIGKAPDMAIFGKNDVTAEKLAARREAARGVSQELLDIAARKKRDELLARVEEQREAEKMLQKNTTEVEEERALKYAAWLAQRRALENDWRRAAAMKAVRDDAEARDRTADPGIPVHEQCSRYRRCGQCRRRLDNSGETNVWADSRFIPGTRYIV